MIEINNYDKSRGLRKKAGIIDECVIDPQTAKELNRIAAEAEIENYHTVYNNDKTIMYIIPIDKNKPLKFVFEENKNNAEVR